MIDKDEEQTEWPVINKKYIVHMKIASGQQGSVVLATERTTRERFAIKIYKVKQEKDYFEKQVQVEMEKLRASKSEHIIRLQDILVNAEYVKPDGTSSSINAIVMDYAPYGNFHDFIYLTGSFTETVAKYYFRQLILGIDYLHNSQNTCHRDLKPDNLLLDKDLELKICDLGLSCDLTNSLNTLVGNLQFVAPEIHAAAASQELSATTCGASNTSITNTSIISGYNGRNADIFSAGVILFLMLTGTYPFLTTKTYTDTTLERYWQSYRHRNQALQLARSEGDSTDGSAVGSGSTSCSSSQVSKPQMISDQAIDLITQMLQKDPLNRISLAEIISHPWLAEPISKKDVMEFMKVQISTYLKETRAELREKKKIAKDGKAFNLLGNSNSSILYSGVQKFRSDCSSSFLEKQLLTEDWIKSLENEKRLRSFQKYQAGEIGLHDIEFEFNKEHYDQLSSKSMKEEEIDQQSIPPMVKYILNFIKTDSSISSITLHPCHYKISFSISDKSSGNQATSKLSIKSNSSNPNLFLLSLIKNQGTKSLGLATYKKIKAHLLQLFC